MKLFLFLLVPWFSLVHAGFMIKPFAVRLQVNKGETTGWLEMAPNQDQRPVAVELGVYERILDLDGKEIDTLVPNKDFVVYPSEVLMYPGDKAKVQVVYGSKKSVTKDAAFMLLAKEVALPLPSQAENTNRVMVGFNALVNYRAVVALETGNQGGLSFVSSKQLDSGKVELVVENKTSGRVPVDFLYLLIGNSKITDFTGKNNSIMPGQKRRFIFKHPKAPTAAEVRFGAESFK